MLRPIIKNKKAEVEFSPAIAIAFIIALLIMAPIMIRIIGTVTGTFFSQMNESAPSAVNEADMAVKKIYNFFDYLIIIALLINVIVLFISAWFIDTNPVFIVLYIMFAFIFVLFLPNLLDAVDSVWSRMESVEDNWHGNAMPLKFTDFIRQHLIMFSVVIIVLTGIITYAKFKIVQGQFT
jgi:hypothetical protein